MNATAMLLTSLTRAAATTTVHTGYMAGPELFHSTSGTPLRGLDVSSVNAGCGRCRSSRPDDGFLVRTRDVDPRVRHVNDASCRLARQHRPRLPHRARGRAHPEDRRM